jgi:hypothetical protein
MISDFVAGLPRKSGNWENRRDHICKVPAVRPAAFSESKQRHIRMVTLAKVRHPESAYKNFCSSLRAPGYLAIPFCPQSTTVNSQSSPCPPALLLESSSLFYHNYRTQQQRQHLLRSLWHPLYSRLPSVIISKYQPCPPSHIAYHLPCLNTVKDAGGL